MDNYNSILYNRSVSYDPTDIQAVDATDLLTAEIAADLARREADDIKWLMSDKRGRRIMWRLLEISGVFRNPYAGSSLTDFRCGAMSIGQRFFAEIQSLCPERYVEMTTEKIDYDNRIAERLRRTE